MLLALFLLDLSLGILAFLPLVGRRNAGVKFYRLVLITCAALDLSAAAAHALAGRMQLACISAAVVGAIAFLYAVLRYPRRLIYRLAIALCGISSLWAAVATFQAAATPSFIASLAGALSSAAILGSMTLAMLLGHWYLVVRGMGIEPLKRLTLATLGGIVVKLVVVAASLLVLMRGGTGAGTAFQRLVLLEGIFFWMRVGWGLLVPLLLFPMIRGTVYIRSTMAATGILYVGVVAVVIGEVLAGFLSSITGLPV